MSFADFTPEQLFFFKSFIGLVFVFSGLWREGILYFYVFPELVAYGEYNLEITVIYIILVGLVKFWKNLFHVAGAKEE